MKQSRLENRIKRQGLTWQIGLLEDHTICFNKIAGDGSGYANIKSRGDYNVWGVLYELTDKETELLDTHERVPKHYLRDKNTQKEIKVNDKYVKAEVYIANSDKCDNSLLPRRGYLNFLIEGAIEHSLLEEYIDYLRKFKTVE